MTTVLPLAYHKYVSSSCLFKNLSFPTVSTLVWNSFIPKFHEFFYVELWVYVSPVVLHLKWYENGTYLLVYIQKSAEILTLHDSKAYGQSHIYDKESDPWWFSSCFYANWTSWYCHIGWTISIITEVFVSC